MLTVTQKQQVVNLTCSFGFISSMDLAKGPYIVFGKGWAIERNSKNSDDDWTNLSITLSVDQSGFLLPVKPVMNSLWFPIMRHQPLLTPLGELWSSGSLYRTLAKGSWSKAKTPFLPRKAFSAVFYSSASLKTPCSSDKTAVTAVSTWIHFCVF